jgi:hypothetical protein
LYVGGKINLADRHERNVQVAEHRAILRSPNDAAQRDHHLFGLIRLLDNESQRRGAGESVRIGIIVRKNDKGSWPFRHAQELM